MTFHNKKRTIILEYLPGLPDIPSIKNITISCVKNTRFNNIIIFAVDSFPDVYNNNTILDFNKQLVDSLEDRKIKL